MIPAYMISWVFSSWNYFILIWFWLGDENSNTETNQCFNESRIEEIEERETQNKSKSIFTKKRQLRSFKKSVDAKDFNDSYTFLISNINLSLINLKQNVNLLSDEYSIIHLKVLKWHKNEIYFCIVILSSR